MAFDISQQVKIVNPTANVDYYYGTYASIAEACASVPFEIRVKGKTVGILTDNGVVEYWWKNGIEDENLVLKNVLESKIIHVITAKDILLLEDDIDYYNRIKNLSVGDLFFWNDHNYTYYYDSSATRKIELEKNCIYRIIPFDSFPKIERVDIGSSSGGSSEAISLEEIEKLVVLDID